MEVDPIRMCELLVGLPEVIVLGVEDRVDGPIAVHVEQAGERPECPGCTGVLVVKDRRLSWSTCRCSVARPGCAGGRFASPASNRIVGSRLGLGRILGSLRLVRR